MVSLIPGSKKLVAKSRFRNPPAFTERSRKNVSGGAVCSATNREQPSGKCREYVADAEHDQGRSVAERSAISISDVPPFLQRRYGLTKLTEPSRASQQIPGCSISQDFPPHASHIASGAKADCASALE